MTSPRVPFVDLKAQHRRMEPELLEALARVVRNASFILGPEVTTFEEAFAGYLGIEHCLAVSSGTAALHLALLALGIGPGDEVVTVPNTFIATAEAVTAVGAHPVFVDVDPLSYTMDPEQAERAITPRTRALLPVHLYGQPADMDPLLEVAQRHNLAVVEDACQAHGAEYKGRKAGTLGRVACFSFYPSKNLGCCGEGGVVVTDDAELAQRVRRLRDHGSTQKYLHAIPGYNLRLEGLQGAVLRLKLPHLDTWNDHRRQLAQQYARLLVAAGVVLPVEMPYARHVYHLYVIQSEQRDALRQFLSGRGIETGLHYPVPVHLQEAYRELDHEPGDFPVSERLAQRGLSLPLYPEMDPAMGEEIAAAINEFMSALAT